MSDTLISIKNLNYSFKELEVLKNISLAFERDKFYAIIGPNGAGKSTLIKLMLGLYKAPKNKIKLCDGVTFGYVPQQISLPKTMPITVLDFLQTWHPKVREADISAHATLTGSVKKYAASIHHLSGGELKRMLIANALIHRPDVLILDEPFAGIDSKGQDAIFKILEEVKAKYQCTIILISHNLSLILPKVDEVICLNKTICCDGRPNEVKSHHHFENLFGPHQ